jgi:hypothetical protein
VFVVGIAFSSPRNRCLGVEKLMNPRLTMPQQEPVLMHLQESPPLHCTHRKRKHDDLGEAGTEEVKAAAPRELRIASSVVYDEPVTHGATPAADRALSKKAKPPR